MLTDDELTGDELTGDELTGDIQVRLRRELAGLTPAADLLPTLRRRHARDVRRRRLASAVLPLVVVAVAVPLAVGVQGPGGATSRQLAIAGEGPGLPLTGPSVQLAGYTFQLPAGYTAATPAPVAGPAFIVATAAASGGSVRIALSGPDAQPPAGSPSRAVTVGPYQGGLRVDPATSVVRLDVAIPARDGIHHMRLTATRLTVEQVLTITRHAVGPNPSSGVSYRPTSPPCPCR